MALFGPAHLAFLAAIAGIAITLVRLVRGNPRRLRQVRLALGVALAGNELVWYWFRYTHEGNRFPDGLPLQLSDITLWVTVAALLAAHRAAFEFCWYAGLAGAGVALLTPDLWAPWNSYSTLYFFIAHGGVVIAPLLMACGGGMRPRPGSVWRVLAMVNVYAAAVGLFNAVFGTNYMYLCHKPRAASPLDLFGPWPFYLLGGEALACGVFLLLWLPFRRSRLAG